MLDFAYTPALGTACSTSRPTRPGTGVPAGEIVINEVLPGRVRRSQCRRQHHRLANFALGETETPRRPAALGRSHRAHARRSRCRVSPATRAKLCCSTAGRWWIGSSPARRRRQLRPPTGHDGPFRTAAPRRRQKRPWLDQPTGCSSISTAGAGDAPRLRITMDSAAEASLASEPRTFVERLGSG
jgi:hypothetical protein